MQTPSQPPSQEGAASADAELLALVAATPWRRQRGGLDRNGRWIAPHEYMLATEHPECYRAIVQRLKAADAWRGTYNGIRYRYVALDGFRYWLSSGGRGRVLMANRARVDQEDDVGPSQLRLWD
ncbi:MAG: hypothetical protein JO352_00240 [Chloroflexi bacterium]|nr:hypothetical protein [Chloroflexota bacterium]MBV9599796.1 hypothetical protein [Chloroflexota bacterium]